VDRLAALMKQYPNLYADISSLTQVNKLGALREEALRAPIVLGPLSAEGLRQAIVEPARRGRGRPFAPLCRLPYSHSERIPARIDAELVRSSGAPSVPRGSGIACAWAKWATAAMFSAVVMARIRLSSRVTVQPIL